MKRQFMIFKHPHLFKIFEQVDLHLVKIIQCCCVYNATESVFYTDILYFMRRLWRKLGQCDARFLPK